MKTSNVTLTGTLTTLSALLTTAGVPDDEIRDMTSGLANSQVTLHTNAAFTVQGVYSSRSAEFPGGVYNVQRNAAALMSTQFSGSGVLNILIT